MKQQKNNKKKLPRCFVRGTDHYSSVWLVLTWKCTLQAISCVLTQCCDPLTGEERGYKIQQPAAEAFIGQMNMSFFLLKQMDSTMTELTEAETKANDDTFSNNSG